MRAEPWLKCFPHSSHICCFFREGFLFLSNLPLGKQASPYLKIWGTPILRVPGTSWDSAAEGISCFGASAPFSVLSSSSEIKKKCYYHSFSILEGDRPKEKFSKTELKVKSLHISTKSTLKTGGKGAYSQKKKKGKQSIKRLREVMAC